MPPHFPRGSSCLNSTLHPACAHPLSGLKLGLQALGVDESHNSVRKCAQPQPGFRPLLISNQLLHRKFICPALSPHTNQETTPCLTSLSQEKKILLLNPRMLPLALSTLSHRPSPFKRQKHNLSLPYAPADRRSVLPFTGNYRCSPRPPTLRGCRPHPNKGRGTKEGV